MSQIGLPAIMRILRSKKAVKCGKVIMIYGVFKAGFSGGWHTTETITNPYTPVTEAAITIGRPQTAGDGGTSLKMAIITDNRITGHTTAALSADVGFQSFICALNLHIRKTVCNRFGLRSCIRDSIF